MIASAYNYVVLDGRPDLCRRLESASIKLQTDRVRFR